MDQGSLSALKRRVNPIALSGSLSLEQAASAITLNRDVERFHAAVAQAERILELAGALDVRLEHELAARAHELTLTRARVEVALALQGDARGSGR